MTKLQKKFGAKVKELRKKHGYTQEQLAELLNIGIRSLGKIETGNSFPSTENLEKIKAALAEYGDVAVSVKVSYKEKAMSEVDEATEKIKRIFGDDIVIVKD